MLEALFVSTAVVALGELGDKTQLLALVLAARYGKPWPIIGGIFVATLVNHAIAGWVGNWVRGAVSADVLRWLLALSFFAVAAWALKPDKLGDDDAPPASKWGVFGSNGASHGAASAPANAAASKVAQRMEAVRNMRIGGSAPELDTTGVEAPGFRLGSLKKLQLSLFPDAPVQPPGCYDNGIFRGIG